MDEDKKKISEKALEFLKDNSNGVMAITSLIGCMIAIFSFFYTVKLFNRNQQQYNESNRPYLTLTGLESSAIDSKAENGNIQIEFNLSLKNFGSLPAFFSITEKNSQNLPIECFQNTQNFILPGQTINTKCIRILGTGDTCELFKNETIEINYGKTSSSQQYKILFRRKMMDLPKYQDPTFFMISCDGKNKIFPWYADSLE